jgi:mono/diheme cytochrome c family protein
MATRSASRVSRPLLAALLTVGTLACDERPEPQSIGRAGGGGAGHILYLTYCQSCHGVEGRGDGPVSGSLRVPPADLTRLWERYGTPLDRGRVAAYIDGRQLFGGHRSGEMPIWGDEFFDDVPPTTPNVEGVKRRLIDVLVDYLEGLQTEREA